MLPNGGVAVNANTLVTVHCYAGDALRVLNHMPCYLHHQIPVIIMSPEDSKVEITGLICRFSGRRAYIGQESLDRQASHMRMALEYPFDFFLMNDSDSFCVSPEIPNILYKRAKEGVVWSGEVKDPRPHASPYPKIAMQPPYFLHRWSLEKMVALSGRIPAHPVTPFIDWWMLALTCEAGLQHESHFDPSDDANRLFWHPVKEIEVFETRREDYRRKSQ